MLPIITQHPRDQVVTAGGAAYFSCAYSAPAPAAASLAWFREGAALEGGGRGTLVLSGVTGAEAGRYYCRVTTGLGTVQSRQHTTPDQCTQSIPTLTTLLQGGRAARRGAAACARDHTPARDCARGARRPGGARLPRLRIPATLLRLVTANCGQLWPTVANCGQLCPCCRYKDGGRLSPAHARFRLVPDNGSLVIDNVQLDDAAHYRWVQQLQQAGRGNTALARCSASNYLGKASSSARVTVETDEPPRAPSITTQPRRCVDISI